jgi:hypothetical protein
MGLIHSPAITLFLCPQKKSDPGIPRSVTEFNLFRMKRNKYVIFEGTIEYTFIP